MFVNGGYTAASEKAISKWRKTQMIVVVVFTICILAVLCNLLVLPLLFSSSSEYNTPDIPCTSKCRVVLVESIPENLTYPDGAPSHVSTYQTWLNLILSAEKTIDIASFYWTLRPHDLNISGDFPSAKEGETIFKELMKAGTNRSIQIRIAHSIPDGTYLPNLDVEELVAAKAAEARALNFTRLMGAGILHTKMWLVDDKHFYVGSANIDFRSLTQVKELGAAVYNCSCLAQDMSKLFEVYWKLGEDGATVPPKWPADLKTDFNFNNTLHVPFNNTDARVVLSSSPPPFCPEGRVSDIDAILHVIDEAKSFIKIAVMDYLPIIPEYGSRSIPQLFWPVIDDRLRKAAIERGVTVQILGSIWNHTSYKMLPYLRSFKIIDEIRNNKVDVKLFRVPTSTDEQKKIPYVRVNHNKYMVTDNVAYIGTSNWDGSYFTVTAGIGLTVNNTATDGPSEDPNTLQKQLLDVFNRDWNSEYAEDLIFPAGN
ncbi:phospholipase D3-like [Anneissia japonica]|uniref:phospholipase D3-like n=1 Tax=Anneissia japonica TaxID=1529436 RepID=UPI001425BAA3|nr:phospholipase D3-like [Anneissia japonica]XP_033110849.1 phospholipase D3-like [Anneissia japonica]XP_033110850.1 phospholipase D3-like [Anneissia japonica]